MWHPEKQFCDHQTERLRSRIFSVSEVYLTRSLRGHLPPNAALLWFAPSARSDAEHLAGETKTIKTPDETSSVSFLPSLLVFLLLWFQGHKICTAISDTYRNFCRIKGNCIFQERYPGLTVTSCSDASSLDWNSERIRSMDSKVIFFSVVADASNEAIVCPLKEDKVALPKTICFLIFQLAPHGKLSWPFLWIPY